MDGRTTNLTTGVAIPFYDEGGLDANYNTPGADWTHTFVAPAGKNLVCIPAFTDIVIDGDERTAIKLIVETK